MLTSKLSHVFHNRDLNQARQAVLRRVDALRSLEYFDDREYIVMAKAFLILDITRDHDSGKQAAHRSPFTHRHVLDTMWGVLLRPIVLFSCFI